MTGDSEAASRASDDGVRIHPHIFSATRKTSKPPDFKKQILRRLKQEGDTKRSKQLAENFALNLSTARTELLRQLDVPPLSDAEPAVSEAFQEYAAQLTGLATASPPGETTDLPQALQPTRMRDAVAFEWPDTLLNSQEITSADAIFELASIVIALSVYRMRRAAYLCKDTRAGIDSAQAGQAYRLMLLAAGGFQFVKDTCTPHIVSVCPSADCTEQAASALLHISLADAQAITTLRAMAKNNAPSLVASLALDTANLYRSAADAAGKAPFSKPSCKPLSYAQYKAAVFQAYALCFAGLVRLKDGQAGQAVRLLEESRRCALAAIPLAAAYNKAEPSSPAADHTEFDRDLNICVDAALARAAKENEHVYYQRPPQELPALDKPRRLVAATALPLPQAADSVKELTALDAFAAVPQAEEQTAPGETARAPLATAGPSSSAPVAPAGEAGNAEAPAEKQESASCWRWLLVILAMPVLVVLSAVGAIIWLVLLPLKIICCPIGCLIQIMADLVEYCLKAPFKALLWASGKPWKAQKVGDVEAQK